MMHLEGKVAMITGAADGIGKAVSVALASAGAEVVLTDIDELGINQTMKQEIRDSYNGNPTRGYGCVLDVTNGKMIKETINEIIIKYGRIDILVNCAGVISSHPLIKLSEAEWDRIMNVNLKGMFLVTKHVFPELIKIGKGKIVNIGSDLSRNGQRFLTHYCASKHGVIGFTRALALESAEYGILVNAVCPGPTETKLHYQDVNMQISYTGIKQQEHLKKEIDSIPLKKLGKPIEIARLVLFLVSDENTHITGETINISGGLVMH